ncbi:MAG TPA: hypothetical protein VN112_12255 [Ensifer sp.]|nr:hypothetical protein [Ensifer sp.]
MSDRLRTVSNLPLILQARQLIALAFPFVLLGSLLYGAWNIGPWFDEFWSFYFSDPSVGLSEAFHSRWTLDVHPPLFSFLSWVASRLGMARTLEAGRMFNLLPLIASAAYFAAVWRLNRDDRAFLATFLPAAAALGQFMAGFVEYRSYFTGVVAFMMLLVSLKRLERSTDDPLSGPNRTLIWTGQIVSLAICLNIHFVTALLAIALVGTFAFAALWRGDRRLFTLHLLTGIACCLPLAATTAAQWTYLSSTSKNFWLKTTQEGALNYIVHSVLSPIGQNAVMRIAWLGALGLRILSRERRQDDDRFAIILMASILSASILVLAYTAATGALTGRYLIPVCLIVVAALASLTGQAIRAYGLMQALFVVACATATIQMGLEAARVTQWNEAARFVSERQKACPGARIAPMRTVLNDATANVEANYEMAYGYLASQWHMKVGALDQMPAAPRDPVCPDYYWADNQFGAKGTEAALQDELLKRFPRLQGCTIQTHIMASEAAVFEVSGEPPQCNR